MPLAMAAPDKREVEPVWTYRWQQVEALGVPVRMSVTADTQALKTYAPDFVIVATGAVPRGCPFDVAALDASIEVLHAWEILREPARVARVQSFTIIGGGMVGIETADLLSQQGKRCTLIEALSSLAPGKARNNRMDYAASASCSTAKSSLLRALTWTSGRRRVPRNVSTSALAWSSRPGPRRSVAPSPQFKPRVLTMRLRAIATSRVISCRACATPGWSRSRSISVLNDRAPGRHRTINRW